MNDKRDRHKFFYLDRIRLSKFINIAIASSKLREIIIHINESNDIKQIRPQMHLLIHGSIGTAKSTILHEIGNQINQQVYANFSKASLMGSADKNTGEYLSPVIWDVRNSALLVDEFQFRGKERADFLNEFLMILEQMEYKKKMGIRINSQPKKREKGGLFLEVSNNTLHVKTRFAFIGATMTTFHHCLNQQTKALVSRCILLAHYPSLADLKSLSEGEPFYILEQIKIPKNKVLIKNNDYKTIIKYCSEHKNIIPETYLRSIGDCCRAFAVLKRHDFATYDDIINLKGQIKW